MLFGGSPGTERIFYTSTVQFHSVIFTLDFSSQSIYFRQLATRASHANSFSLFILLVCFKTVAGVGKKWACFILSCQNYEKSKLGGNMRHFLAKFRGQRSRDTTPVIMSRDVAMSHSKMCLSVCFPAEQRDSQSRQTVQESQATTKHKTIRIKQKQKKNF